MKKLITVILLSAMICTLAACRGAVDPAIEPSAVPTTAEPTVEPTSDSTVEPTTVPTAKPTAEPTAAPTAIPAPTELDFDSCAELVLRLPWGDGENEVFIERPIEGYDDEDWVIPEHFNIIDGTVYVYDRFYPHGNGVLEYDPATGAVTRLSPDIGDYDFFDGEFAVLDGKVIFGAYMFDLETGERTELQRIPNSDYAGAGILIMSVRNGKCFAYRAVDQKDDFGQEFFFVQDTHAYDEYELDMENRMWVLK